jgi:hypothetical protein
MKPTLAVLVAALAAALAAAGCGGSSITGIRGASIVPASAAAFIAIDSDSDSSQWESAKELASRFPGQADAVGELEESLRAGAGLDFQEDVRPALGPEVDLVWLDFANDGQNVVGLLQPDDPEAFRRAVAEGNATDPSAKLLYEEVDGWMVISDKQGPIDAFRRAVEADGPVLADDEAFDQAMDDYASGAIFKAYVSGDTVMQELRAEVPAEDREFLDKVGTLEWLALALRTSDEGIRFDVTVRGTPGSLLQSSAGTAAPDFELKLPGELPGDILAYLAFHDLGGALTDLENNPALRDEELGELRTILRRAGSLLEGEGALYVRPSDGEVPEVTLVTTPREGTDAAATLDRILGDAEVADKVESNHIAGTDARLISIGDMLQLGYANVDGKLVVTTAPGGIADVVDPSSSLADAGAFKDAVDASGAPDNVQSFFFVDVRGGLGLAEQLAGAPIPDAVARNLKPLKSVVQYAASRPSEVQLTFFLRIDEPQTGSGTETETS